jgi:hypothetical protein
LFGFFKIKDETDCATEIRDWPLHATRQKEGWNHAKESLASHVGDTSDL